MDNEQLIRRGENCRRLLEDDLFIEAFESLRKLYVETWMNSEDVATRELQHQKLTALAQFKLEFAKQVVSGDFARRRAESANL